MCFILLIFLGKPASAQVFPSDSLLIRALASDGLLPGLIDSAIIHSPIIKRIGSSIGLAEENEKIAKKAIFSGLNFNSTYVYGTTGNFSNSQSNTSTAASFNFNTVQTSFYNFGVNFQMPLTNIINRKNLLKVNEYQVKIAQADKENAELYIRQETTRNYMLFKLAQKKVMLGNQNKTSAYINYKLAEKEFSKGDLTIDEYSKIQDIYNKASLEFEGYLNEFQNLYLQLEAFSGTKLSTLIDAFK
jgi:outer membrane protein TolC